MWPGLSCTACALALSFPGVLICNLSLLDTRGIWEPSRARGGLAVAWGDKGPGSACSSVSHRVCHNPSHKSSMLLLAAKTRQRLHAAIPLHAVTPILETRNRQKSVISVLCSVPYLTPPFSNLTCTKPSLQQVVVMYRPLNPC